MNQIKLQIMGSVSTPFIPQVAVPASNSYGSTHTGPRSEEGLFIRDTEEELKLAGALPLNYISETPTTDTNKEKTLCHRKKRKEKEGRAEIGFKGQCRPFGAYVNTHVCAHVCACVLPRFYILLLISKNVSFFYTLNSFSMH